MTTTFQRVSAILVANHDVPSDMLTPDVSLRALGIDSLTAVELMWSVEEAFGLALPAQSVRLDTIGDVVGFVDRLVAAQHRGADKTACGALRSEG